MNRPNNYLGALIASQVVQKKELLHIVYTRSHVYAIMHLDQNNKNVLLKF
jgi:hypothetical protein